MNKFTLAALLGSAAALTNQEKMAQNAQGFLEAYGGKFNLEALLICIYQEDQALLAFDMAYQIATEAIKNKDPMELIGAAIAVVAGYQQFRQGLPACESVDTTTFDFAQMTKNFEAVEHPVAHYKQMEAAIENNKFAILAKAEEGVAAFEAQNFEGFGKAMGEILKMATTEKPEVVDEEPTVDRKAIAETFAGLAEATHLGHFDFTALLICVYEEDQAALIALESFKIWKEAIQNKDIQEAIGGVITTIAAFQQFKKGLPACESVDSKSLDWTHFDKIVSTLEHPEKHMTQIAQNIIFNGKTVTKEMASAVDALNSEDYQQFGLELGSLLETAIEGEAELFLF